MKALALAICLPLLSQAPPGYYDTKRIVWYDKYDNQGSPWLWGSRDKQGHFLMGAAVGSWAALFAEHNGWKRPWLWGLIAGALVGIVKEVCDHQRWGFAPLNQKGGSGTAEIMDAVWTGVGGAAGGAITIRIKF